jgi:hypothetical protein
VAREFDAHALALEFLGHRHVRRQCKEDLGGDAAHRGRLAQHIKARARVLKRVGGNRAVQRALQCRAIELVSPTQSLQRTLRAIEVRIEHQKARVPEGAQRRVHTRRQTLEDVVHGALRGVDRDSLRAGLAHAEQL